MRKVSFALFLLSASLSWLSCGSSPSSGSTQTSGLKFRALISNNVSAGTEAAGLYILNAQTDVRANSGAISAGAAPGMMVVTPNHNQTLVFSGTGTQFSDNQLSIVNNASEQNAAHSTLPGLTESIVVSPDSSAAYVAVPNGPVTGQTPGIIEVVSLGTGSISGTIGCPAGNPTPAVCVSTDSNLQGVNPPFKYLSMGNTGTRMLAFSEGAGTNFDSVPNVVAVISPANLQTGSTVITLVPGFDHPVWAYFNSDDTTAYVVNCGAECGGTQASVQLLDLTTNTAGQAFNVPAATVALVDNSTMYLAGTPLPAPPCTGQTTQATTCGVLTLFNLSTMSIMNPAPITITDGYHNRIALGANGQLFIGGRSCTEIIPTVPVPVGAEVRGCLSIYNSLNTAVGPAPPNGVLIPPETGEVTGIQPIATREVVYVVQGQNVQGGTLYIYDDTTDVLYLNPNDSGTPGQISSLVGNFVDVKTIDF